MVCCCRTFFSSFIFGVACMIQDLTWAVIWLIFIIRQGNVEETIYNLKAVSTILYSAAIIVLLVFLGVESCYHYKDRQKYLLNYYLIYSIVMTVLVIISCFITFFNTPGRFEGADFLGTIPTILIQVLCFFIITNYYMSLQAKQENINPA